ncbi:MAG: hypothetical protein HY690_19185 [Chloroflexi bacterium]|nr:hypothetical protein [Chloroflexota bacterium]
MLDRAVLERDLRYLEEFVQTAAFEVLRHDLPAPLQPGMAIVDLDAFLAALRSDLAAALAADRGGLRSPVLEASAQAVHNLVAALRDLLDARESEAAGWDALAELPG